MGWTTRSRHSGWELEELNRITASVFNMSSDESFTVGNDPSSLPEIPDLGGEPVGSTDAGIVSGFDLDGPGELPMPSPMP